VDGTSVYGRRLTRSPETRSPETRSLGTYCLETRPLETRCPGAGSYNVVSGRLRDLIDHCILKGRVVATRESEGRGLRGSLLN